MRPLAGHSQRISVVDKDFSEVFNSGGHYLLGLLSHLGRMRCARFFMPDRGAPGCLGPQAKVNGE